MQKVLLWSGKLFVLRMEGMWDWVFLWGLEVGHFSSHSQESFGLLVYVPSPCSLSKTFEYLRSTLRGFPWVSIMPHLANVLTCKKKGIELAKVISAVQVANHARLSPGPCLLVIWGAWLCEAGGGRSQQACQGLGKCSSLNRAHLLWLGGGVGWTECLVSLLYGNLVSIVCLLPPLLTLNFLKGILLGVLTGASDNSRMFFPLYPKQCWCFECAV